MQKSRISKNKYPQKSVCIPRIICTLKNNAHKITQKYKNNKHPQKNHFFKRLEKMINIYIYIDF